MLARILILFQYPLYHPISYFLIPLYLYPSSHVSLYPLYPVKPHLARYFGAPHHHSNPLYCSSSPQTNPSFAPPICAFPPLCTYMPQPHQPPAHLIILVSPFLLMLCFHRYFVSNQITAIENGAFTGLFALVILYDPRLRWHAPILPQ